MLFNSFEFLYIYLPATVFLFFITLKLKKYHLTGFLLSVSSLIFYGYSNIQYLSLLLGSIAFNYIIGSLLLKRKDIHFLFLGILLNLIILGYYKYFNFFLETTNLSSLFHLTIKESVLPLAISFYTFQQIVYLLDCYKGLVKSNGFINYLFFVSFFPQLIAGPIVQHQEIIFQLDWKERYNKFSRNMVVGLTVFAIGLFKKTVIADNLGALATPVFTAVTQVELPL
ncbi:MAG: hypothetical protein U1E78_04940 [Gammaproteobacteria bacterium]